MISYLQGQIKRIGEKSLTLLVGGVGYEIYTTNDVLGDLRVAEDKEFFIVTVVKEDAFDLYGFLDASRYHFFKLLISISGIGPKSALGILDAADTEDIRQAIVNNDPGLLQKLNGVGKKTAERIVMELKTKIGTGLVATSGGGSSEVVDALESLGYHALEIREAIKQIDSNLSTEEKVSQVLKLLGR